MFRLWIVTILVWVSFGSGVAFSSEKGDEGDETPSAEKERKVQPNSGPDGLPVFRHPYTDGLYSTVTAMNMFYIPEEDLNKKIKKQKLKVPGFKKELPIFTVFQNYEAPLVVVLLGADGKVEGPWGGLFPYWYAEAGYHVLTFDTSFSPLYSELSGQGVVGNFDAEADQIAQIVAAFLKTPDAKKVTQVGVIGLSFGGTQALLLAAKAKEGKLPFELSGCLALCPPIKMKTAAKAVDKFFLEDRWDTTMVELAKKFAAHAPVAEGQKIPFTATELRAAIGFVFRDGLTEVVERNDRYYKLKILPSDESGDNRKDYAAATGFERFMEDYTFPYWQKKGSFKTLDEFWACSDLTRLIPRLPDWAEIVIAANDPFNTEDDLAEVRKVNQQKNVTVLPRGGHMGFIAADWTLVKALRIFRRKGGVVPESPDAPAVEDNRSLDEARKEALEGTKEALKQAIPPASEKEKVEKEKKK